MKKCAERKIALFLFLNWFYIWFKKTTCVPEFIQKNERNLNFYWMDDSFVSFSSFSHVDQSKWQNSKDEILISTLLCALFILSRLFSLSFSLNLNFNLCEIVFLGYKIDKKISIKSESLWQFIGFIFHSVQYYS